MNEQVDARRKDKYTRKTESDENLYADVEINHLEMSTTNAQPRTARNLSNDPGRLEFIIPRNWTPDINTTKADSGSSKMLNKKVVIGMSSAVVSVLIVVIVVVTTRKGSDGNDSDVTTNDSGTTLSATVTAALSSSTAPTTTTLDSSYTIPPGDKFKLECVAGSIPDSPDLCSKRGCTWQSSVVPGVPQCLLPSTAKFGYKVAGGRRPDLTLDESGKVRLKVARGSFFGKDFQEVEANFQFLHRNILRVKFTDTKVPRYEVPVELETDFKVPDKGKADYKVQLETDDIFSFRVLRRSSGQVLFDTEAGSLFLAERHVEVTTRLPNTNVFGLGESAHRSFRHDFRFRKWPLFSRDQFPDPWDGDGNHNLYGVHPFYTCLEKNGSSHGVLFFNSNAMEVTLTPMPALNFRSTGGILDMFFFLGDYPEHVIQLYTQVVGRPLVPPYWSLGFHLSRYGFNSLDNMEAAIRRTRDKRIPLDVIHADIDHLENNMDFTWDPERFPNFDQFVKDQQNQGLRVIVIVDPALLANVPTYKPYKEGEDEDVYIEWPSYIGKEKRGNPPGVNADKNITFARVWPSGPVAFPDFFKERTRKWWTRTIREYRAKVPFDAIWLDMNEPAVFGTDAEEPWYCPTSDPRCWALECPDNPWDSLNDTFHPAAASVHGAVKLSDKTLCMATVLGDTDHLLHYNVHSIYGWTQAKATLDALTVSATRGQPPFILTRSTYPSSGRYAGHWLGDNKSRWEDLRASLIGTMEFNLFGIPYVGADICGFFLNSTGELCGRWMQVGAFYPFSRNHNTLGTTDQDPGNQSFMRDKDIKRAKFAMDTRYQLLPYLHTLHYLAHLQGWTVVRPLFHEFPTDTETIGIDVQFLWGSALLVSPALYRNQSEIKYYLPDDVWYDFYSGSVVETSGDEATSTGIWQVETDTERVPLHVRGGHVIPTKERGATDTRNSREKNFELRIYPKSGLAEGLLYWTGEEANDLNDKDSFRVYRFDFNQSTVVFKVLEDGDILPSNLLRIRKIFVYDQNRVPESGRFGNKTIKKIDFDYQPINKITTIYLDINLFELRGSDEWTLKWF